MLYEKALLIGKMGLEVKGKVIAFELILHDYGPLFGIMPFPIHIFLDK